MRRREGARTCAALVISGLAWAIWLSWDREYDIDPVTSSASGPYQSWQVVGCVLTLLGAAVLAGRVRRPAVAALVVAVPFTVCWTVDAASRDDSGLFAVGAVLVAAGLYLGSWAAATVAGRATPRGAPVG